MDEIPNFVMEEPNRIADEYRNYCPPLKPMDVELHLDFIDISEDGYAILGSSDLSGRYIRGSVWYFKNASLAPLKEKSISSIECDISVCEGKFIDNKKTIIIGDDLGAVTVLELTEEEDQSFTLERKNSRHDHDSNVLTISVSAEKNNVVTAGMDLCIKVWDIQELVPSYTFPNAHSNFVTSVAYSSNNSAVFASCGLDGVALLWDTRQPKPATVLVQSCKENLTALAWQAGDGNLLNVGSDFGNVSLVDVRTPAQPPIKTSCVYQKPIYRLLSINPSSLAACADSHEVKVVDPLSEDFSVRYVDSRHSDFVRGLSYDKSSRILYSCGWDKEVVSHSWEA